MDESCLDAKVGLQLFSSLIFFNKNNLTYKYNKVKKADLLDTAIDFGKYVEVTKKSLLNLD